ncbi:MAG: hypothetical protein CSA74_10075 [Rhodobacterales bacterium]|nr:MAG: hypothetical protein CSA74_10075 [Rhodobacterales bacterium]
MKITKFAPVALSLLLAAPAFAEAANPDADGDGVVSMEEFVAAWPDLKEDSFALVDTNKDGTLDAEEITAATEAGLLPALDL